MTVVAAINGQAGYCKVCVAPIRSEIDRHFTNGESISAVARWTREAQFPISRPTLASHLAHAIDPRSTLVEKVRKNPTIKRVTSGEFVQAVIDAGAAKVEADPAAVSIDQALRAAQIAEGRKDNSRDTMRVLVLALTGRAEADTIQGEYRALPAGKD